MLAGHAIAGAAGFGAGSFGLLQAESVIETVTSAQRAAVRMRSATVDYSAPMPR
jgi:hypothetical protein